MGMKKMIRTIQKGTTEPLPTIARSVTAPTKIERFGVDMQMKSAVKMYQTQKNFTWNVEPASSREASGATFFDTSKAGIYFAVIVGHEFEKYTSRQMLIGRRKWRNTEYRRAYMEAAVEQGIAWQIKINRERSQLGQSQLGEMIGTSQPGVSRLEDPSYGRHSLDTLMKIANAFDCALQVKFVPYSKLARESHDLAPEFMYAVPYSVEISE